MHQLIIPVYRVSLCLIGMSNVNPLHDTPLVDLSVGFHWAHMTWGLQSLYLALVVDHHVDLGLHFENACLVRNTLHICLPTNFFTGATDHLDELLLYFLRTGNGLVHHALGVDLVRHFLVVLLVEFAFRGLVVSWLSVLFELLLLRVLIHRSPVLYFVRLTCVRSVWFVLHRV